MLKIIKPIIIVSLIVFALTIGASILAQENTNSDRSDVTADEQITAQDLEVSNPNLLPDNPFYFLKEWTRKIRSALTFNETKKTDLENTFANEKLLELRKMAKNGMASDKIQKATENYQKAIEKVKNAADKIKDKAENNSEVNKFLEKFTNQQILHEKILEKLETQVPEQALEKIKEAREQHLEKFKDVMTKLENNKDKIAERIKNALQNGDEGNSEILDRINEKMPNDIKQKIENIKESVREKVNNKLIEKATEKNESKNCPVITKPAPDFCKQGKIKVERDDKGCVIKFKCVEITSEKTNTTNTQQ